MTFLEKIRKRLQSPFKDVSITNGNGELEEIDQTLIDMDERIDKIRRKMARKTGTGG